MRSPTRQKKQAWEALFRRELGGVIAVNRQRRQTLYGGLAAIMVLAAGVFLLLSPPAQQAIVVAEVMSTIDDNQTFRNGNKADPLTQGSSVHVGQTIRTAATGMLALAYRNADIRLNVNTTVRFHAAAIELISGGIYVDTGDHPHTELPVIVTTVRGSFSHVGTQFMVEVDVSASHNGAGAEEVKAAVREGVIMLRTEDVQRNFSPTDGGAEVVTISRSGTIDTQVVERNGDLWDWVVTTSPGRKINGLSYDEVLHWIAREMGLTVKYASKQAERVARKESFNAPDDDTTQPLVALRQIPGISSLVPENFRRYGARGQRPGLERYQHANRRNDRHQCLLVGSEHKPPVFLIKVIVDPGNIVAVQDVGDVCEQRDRGSPRLPAAAETQVERNVLRQLGIVQERGNLQALVLINRPRRRGAAPS